MKLTVPPSDPSNPSTLKEEIEQAILQRDGSISPYSSQVFEAHTIIYQKDETVIVTNTPTNTIGTFFAVEDTDCPNRYFIAFAFSVGAMTESITGLLVYFNEKGHCSSDRTNICQCVLATYDMRNGIIREKQMYLYHQTLLFTQTHRDTRRLILYLHYIPYRSDIIEDRTSYYTNYILPYCCSAIWGESITLFKRFLHIPLMDTALFFDLGSLECIEEKLEDIQHRYVTIQSYHLYKKEQVSSFLEIAPLFPEKDYSDGYPIHCIQCHHKTMAGTYTYKLTPGTTTCSGLGNSYCSDCHIRYSDSKKQWLCAAIKVNGSICNSYLLEPGCRSEALHASDQNVVLLDNTPLLKYPYRRHVHVQWAPSEEAADCARESYFITDFYETETPPKAEDDIINNE